MKFNRPVTSSARTATRNPSAPRTEARQASALLETLEARRLLTTFVITTTADAGAGSLRDAIIQANSNPGLDTIDFHIAGSGIRTIELASPLPVITSAVTIDGSTNDPNYAPGNAPLVQIDGLHAGSAANGLTIGDYGAAGPIAPGSGSIVKDLAITGFGGYEISIGSSGNKILGNYIGTVDGVTAAPNNGSVTTGSSGTPQTFTGTGIFDGGYDTQIGGTDPGDGNVISGNPGVGIDAAFEDETVEGNLIGVNAAGTAALPNGVGIYDNGTAIIGGTTAAARNVISGNGVAIAIYEGGVTLQGNYIGLNAAGTAEIANALLFDGGWHSSITLGGTAAGAGNVIDGFEDNPLPLTTWNSVGNLIGTDAAGNPIAGQSSPFGVTLISAEATGVNQTTVTFTLPFPGMGIGESVPSQCAINFYAANSANHAVIGDDWTLLDQTTLSDSFFSDPQEELTAVIPATLSAGSIIAADAMFIDDQYEGGPAPEANPMEAIGYSTIRIPDTNISNVSTGDTSTGENPTADTSTGDTSTVDTSTGDTSTGDTSTGNTSLSSDAGATANGGTDSSNQTGTSAGNGAVGTALPVNSVTNSAAGVTLASNAHATSPIVIGRTTKLLALGVDVDPNIPMTYTWSVIRAPAAGRAPLFSINGTTEAHQSTVTFMKDGTFTFQCTISDSSGHSITSDVSVIVEQTLTHVASLAPRTVHRRQTYTFHAYAYDQFWDEMRTQPAIHYSIVNGGGTINSRTGGFAAGNVATEVVIKARYGSLWQEVDATVV